MRNEGSVVRSAYSSRTPRCETQHNFMKVMPFHLKWQISAG
jgi:hypothetical protein